MYLALKSLVVAGHTFPEKEGENLELNKQGIEPSDQVDGMVIPLVVVTEMDH